MAKSERKSSDLPSRESMIRYVLDCLWIESELGPNPDLKLAEIFEKIRAALLLSTDDRHDGRHKRVKSDESRIRRALYILRDSGLAESPKKGTYRITRGGKLVAASKATGTQISEIISSASPRSAGPASRGEGMLVSRLLAAQSGKSADLGAVDFDRTKECQALLCLLAPEGSCGNYMFEKIAARLTEEISQQRCEVTPKCRDEGIDGKGWNGNELSYYMQAKRYSGAGKIANPPVQQLIGCCVDEVPVGYFVTTATFAASAKKVIRRKKSISIVPVDGHKVARMKYDMHVGFDEDGAIDFNFFRRLLK